MRKLGAEPTTTKPDGSPEYTLPTIHDDKIGKVVADSIKIAEYLEATYPDKPSLFPFGAHAPIHMSNAFFFPTAISPALLVFLASAIVKLHPASLEYFRRTREPVFGKKLEEVVPQGEARAAQLAAAKEGYARVAEIY